MTRIQEINEEIKKLYEEKKQLQEACTHSVVKYKYGSNTGNYDPSDNCYWIDLYCIYCEKAWTEAQDNYNTYWIEKETGRKHIRIDKDKW